MRKDIYVVTITNRLSNITRISDEGYDNIYGAMYFIENQIDKPKKELYKLTWVSEEFIYEIHLIKVGD